MPEIMRPTTDEYAPFYQGYVQRVPDDDIRLILRVQLDDTLALLRPLTDEQATFRYAPNKWSVLQVVGHLIDAERIFVYRATCVARGDRTPLPGFDENSYAEAGQFDRRALHSLTGEWEAVRHSTAAFFQHLPDQAWTRIGTANNNPISVRALAYITAGHELHHREILQNRYLPALAGEPSGVLL